MTKEIELSQALSAKICHDLSSSIGTIDNCLSLLDNQDSSIKSRAKELVNLESTNLINRIRFFKIAYGPEDSEPQISVIKTAKIIKDFAKGLNIKINFDVDDGILFINKSLAKGLIIMSSVAADNVRDNGNLIVELMGDNNYLEVEMIASSRNLLIREESVKTFEDDSNIKVSVNNCREVYAKTLLSGIGYNIHLSVEADSIKYKFTRNQFDR